MNINYLLKYAFNFENKIKQASLRGNMAKRILFSLLSHLVPIGEQARVAYTKGMVDSKALKQMIPGAKEIIDYGIKACIEEGYFNKFADNKLEELKQSNDKKHILSSLIDIFKSPQGWAPRYGGEPWAKIASTLLNIQTHLENAQEAKKNYDWDKENEELMNMTAYVNVLDGLAHNTGSIMDKIINIENESRYGDNYYGYNPEKDKKMSEEQDKILRLMDIKELEDPDDVLQEILPTLDNETDANLTMKDWMTAARKKKHEYKGSEEERNKKINLIRKKKQLQILFTNIGLYELKDQIKSIINLPDNKMLEAVIRNWKLYSNFEHMFNSIYYYNEYKVCPQNFKISVEKDYEYVKKIIPQPGVYSPKNYLEQLNEIPLNEFSKSVYKSWDIVNKLETIINYLTVDNFIEPSSNFDEIFEKEWNV